MYSEFQIGNYVSFKKNHYRIVNIQRNPISTLYYLRNIAGNDVEDEDDEKWREFKLNPIRIADLYDVLQTNVDSLPNSSSKIIDEVFLNNAYCGIEISYVHELQNIYKKITGQELT